MAPALRPESHTPHRLLTTVAALVLLALSGCGGVYEELAPAQKRVVDAVLVPDFVRGGEEAREVVAFIDVDPQNTYLSEFPDFGDGIGVTRTVTGSGCSTTAMPPADFERSDPLRICLELQVAPTVAPGDRLVEFNLRSSGEAVLARASFFVLPPLR